MPKIRPVTTQLGDAIRASKTLGLAHCHFIGKFKVRAAHSNNPGVVIAMHAQIRRCSPCLVCRRVFNRDRDISLQFDEFIRRLGQGGVRGRPSDGYGVASLRLAGRSQLILFPARRSFHSDPQG